MAKTYGSVVVCQRCSVKEVTAGNITHGMTHSILYRRWADMIQRCERKIPETRKNYLDRGITVCKEWKKFEPFMQWALANGFSPKLQIDRIDNDKGYSADNCRWATRSQNMGNMRKTIWVEIDGERMSLAQACTKLGRSYNTVYARLRYGWNVYEALHRS